MGGDAAGARADGAQQKLAKVLADGRDPDSWEAYGRESFGIGATTGLDAAAIFASFMYAIEQQGWTRGRWRVRSRCR